MQIDGPRNRSTRLERSAVENSHTVPWNDPAVPQRSTIEESVDKSNRFAGTPRPNGCLLGEADWGAFRSASFSIGEITSILIRRYCSAGLAGRIDTDID
jgi:hypothetical protein